MELYIFKLVIAVLLLLAIFTTVLLTRWKKERWFFGLFFLWVGIAMILPVKLSPKLDFSVIRDSMVGIWLFIFAGIAFAVLTIMAVICSVKKRKKAAGDQNGMALKGQKSARKAAV